MRGRSFRGDVRKSFFTQRVVTVWNALPGRVVEAGCLTSFKNYPNELLAHHDILGNGTCVGRQDRRSSGVCETISNVSAQTL